ncbi:hypothetical protein M9H77_25244 [Catharanthus roseus]|uniref:Uncharacterized protein n=1 Tax=Catharanthus roseus TaxID=4058 RepID=A0ACC0A789_CATRO|nr:hypothetical protein M9H77_25244 [Catharanthus roseus]
MTRRSTRRKTSATNLLETPLPETSPPPMTPTRSASESPKEFGFNFNTTSKLHSSTSMKKNTSGGTSVSKLLQPTVRSSLPSLKGINNVSDLKQLASSQMESLKRQLDRSHEEITKEIEASQSRLQKRFKSQTQACQKLMDEADIDHKNMLERIDEGRESMNASFTEFMAEAQASAARVFKTSIPDISKSVEKAIGSLRSRYGISST